MIVDIINENFLYPATNPETNGDKSARTLHTNASVADGEVLAIGGLSRNVNKNSNTSVPILSKIPIIGNFFKNKTQVTIKESLIIFITPKIIYPGQNLTAFTKNKADFANSVLSYTDLQDGNRDPIAKWLFKETEEHKLLNDFIHKYPDQDLPVKPNKSRQAISNSVAEPSDKNLELNV
jgi:type II secretory pathway component GspD/PulD (secretin)